MDPPEAVIEDLEAMVAYLMPNKLYLATAESCTAGLIAAALGSVPGGGKVTESGYVVYSPTAKQRLLGVSLATIDQFGLTSEEVAQEMAKGALEDSEANVAVATTGVAGPYGRHCPRYGLFCRGVYRPGADQPVFLDPSVQRRSPAGDTPGDLACTG